MSKKKGSRTALITILVVLVIFAALTFATIKYFIPMYQISQNEVYIWAVKLFPLLVGLTLIVIASLLGRDDKDNEDEDDKLPPNSYEKHLFETPVDDPNKAAQPVAQVDQTEPTPFISIFDAQPATVKEVEEEVEGVKEEPKAEEFEEEEAKNEPDVKPVETPVEDSAFVDHFARIEAQIEALTNNVEKLAETIKDIQTPIVLAPTSQPVQETAKPVSQPVTVVVDESANQTYKDYEGSTARQAAEAEYDCAKDFDYDFNIAKVSAKIEDISLQLGDAGKCIENGANTIVVVPFVNQNEAKEILNKLNIPYNMRSMEAGSDVSFDDLVKDWIN